MGGLARGEVGRNGRSKGRSLVRFIRWPAGADVPLGVRAACISQGLLVKLAGSGLLSRGRWGDVVKGPALGMNGRCGAGPITVHHGDSHL